MEDWYDNYCFAPRAVDTKMFNTDMVLYFLNCLVTNGRYPDVLEDRNVKTDYAKLKHLIMLDNKLGRNFSVINRIAEKGEISVLINSSFPEEKLVETDNFQSLLYYFGILSIDRVESGTPVLRVPNKTIQKLLFSYIVEGLDSAGVFSIDFSLFKELVKNAAYHGEWRPMIEFLAEQVKEQSSIRDYMKGEKVVQTFYRTYIGLLRYFDVETERELNKGYADVFLNPNRIEFPDIKNSYVIEFKYCERGNDTEVATLREQAKQQLKAYGQNGVQAPGQKLIYIIHKGWELLECGEA